MKYQTDYLYTQKRLNEIESIQAKIKISKKNDCEELIEQVLRDAQNKKISLRRLIKGIEK